MQSLSDTGWSSQAQQEDMPAYSCSKTKPRLFSTCLVVSQLLTA